MIYQYSWFGANTRWEYRLRVIPAGDTVIDRSTEPITYIPEGVVKLTEGEKGHENLLLGMSKAPRLKFKWNTNLIPKTAEYDELYQALHNPIQLDNTSVVHENFHITYLEFEKGTIYELDVKYNGNDDSDVFRPFFYGIQYDEVGDLYKEETQTIEMEVIDKTRVVYEAIRFSTIDGVTVDYTMNSAIDLLCSYTTDAGAVSNLKIIHHASTMESQLWYGMIKRFAFVDFLEQTANEIIKKMFRVSSSNITIAKPGTVKYYKQNYTGDGGRGSELTKDEQYLIAFISQGENTSQNKILGAFSFDGYYDLNGGPNSIITKYTNAWDYLNDYFEDTLSKGYCYFGNVNYAAMFSDLHIVNLSKEDLSNIKLVKSKRRTSTIKSIITDTVDNDITEITKSDGFSRNKNNYTIPMRTNNLPTDANDYAIVDNGGWSKRYAYMDPDLFSEHDKIHAATFFGDQAILTKSHIYGIYYLDVPSFISTLFQNQGDSLIIRTHEKITQEINWDETNEAYFSISDIDYANTEMKDLPSHIQSRSGKPLIQAKTLAKVLNGRLPGLLFEIQFWQYTEFLLGGSIGNPWWDYERNTYQFDPADLDPRLSYLPNKWFITNVKYDFQKETAKVEAIPRRI